MSSGREAEQEESEDSEELSIFERAEREAFKIAEKEARKKKFQQEREECAARKKQIEQEREEMRKKRHEEEHYKLERALLEWQDKRWWDEYLQKLKEDLAKADPEDVAEIEEIEQDIAEAERCASLYR